MSRPLRTPCALLGASLLACAVGVHAGSPVNAIVVTTLADGIDEFDGSCSLREAVRNARLNQASPVAGECAAGSAAITDEIVLVGGETYALTVAGDGNDEGHLFLSQAVSIGLDLRIRATTTSPATISQTVAGQRVIWNSGLGVELSNLVIRGGSTAGTGGGIVNVIGDLRLERVNVFSNSAFAGGGISNSGRLEAIDSEFQLNSATFGGGAIYNVGSGGTVALGNVLLRANTAARGGAIDNSGDRVELFDGTSVSLNQATGTDGGAIFNTDTGRLSIVGASFEANTAQDRGGAIFTDSSNSAFVVDTSFSAHNAVLGGAIFQVGTADLMVSGSTFRDNSSASDGGAVRASNAEIDGSLFEANTAFLGDGGAILGSNFIILREGTVLRGNAAINGGGIHAQIVDLLDSRVEANTAVERGGGLMITNHGDIVGSRVTGNSAGLHGGGLLLGEGGVQTTDIQRSLFDHNTATGNGGGLWLGDEVVMGNTTVVLNGADDGGGGLYISPASVVTAINITVQGHLNGQDLHKFGTLNLQNSIISTPGQPDCVTSIDNVEINSLGHNIADDDSCLGLDEISDRMDTDPMLDALAEAGGTLPTLAPLPGSLAINRGNAAGCAAYPVEGVDQRNAPRPFGGACDIGAHETGADAPSDLFGDGFEDD